MEATIVVGFDDSDAARAALRWAIEAAPLRHARLLVLSVLPSATAWGLASIQIDPEPLRRAMRRRLEARCARLLSRSTVQHRVAVVEGNPANELRHAALEADAALIVVGATRHGAIAELALGSVARDLAHRSPVPVVVVPPDAGVSTQPEPVHAG